MLVIFWPGSASEILAVRIEDLDLNRHWQLGELVITGNDRLKRSDLTGMLLTQTRPWYRFWSDYPAFDPVTFRADLARLRRLYEARGFYHAVVDYDLTVDAGDALVSAHIIVDEGAPVIAGEIDLSVSQNSTSPERLPIATKEAREIRFGVAYGSEDRFRTQLEWRHNNWLGETAGVCRS